MRKILVVGLSAFASLLVLSLDARAQGSIAGAVKDPSGAVLPGVTVEAASPALIEKTRTAVTDIARQLPHRRPAARHLCGDVHAARVQDRAPRRHRHPGHVRRAGQRASCRSARSKKPSPSPGTPTVDVSNNTAQFVVDRDILDAIPTPIRNTPSRALLLPGTQVTPFVLGQYT